MEIRGKKSLLHCFRIWLKWFTLLHRNVEPRVNFFLFFGGGVDRAFLLYLTFVMKPPEASVCLWFASFNRRSMVERTRTPAVFMASLDQYTSCVLYIFFNHVSSQVKDQTIQNFHKGLMNVQKPLFLAPRFRWEMKKSKWCGCCWLHHKTSQHFDTPKKNSITSSASPQL